MNGLFLYAVGTLSLWVGIFLIFASVAKLVGRTVGTSGGVITGAAGLALVAIGVLSPSVFWIVFGSEWEKAGLLIAWMTPWFVLQFLASPVSMALHVTGNQRAAMSFQFFALCLRVFSVLWAAEVWPGLVGEAYAISGFFVYSNYLLIVAHSLRIRPGALAGVLAKNLLWSLPWIICGAMLAWTIHNYSGLAS